MKKFTLAFLCLAVLACTKKDQNTIPEIIQRDKAAKTTTYLPMIWYLNTDSSEYFIMNGDSISVPQYLPVLPTFYAYHHLGGDSIYIPYINNTLVLIPYHYDAQGVSDSLEYINTYSGYTTWWHR